MRPTVDPEGRILVPRPGVGRELTERRRDENGNPVLRTKEWELPPGPDGRTRRAFQSTMANVHWVDGGVVRTRRLRWIQMGPNQIGCITDARKLFIDTDDLAWRMIHRDGTQIRSRITHIDGVPVTTIPSATVTFDAPNIVRVHDIATDTDWRLFIGPDMVAEVIRLKSDASPREWEWSIVTTDTEKFVIEDTNEKCRENLDNLDRPLELGDTPNRYLEIDDFGGPQIDVLPNGDQRVRIHKLWTGRVSRTSPDRVPEWEIAPALYPVQIR